MAKIGIYGGTFNPPHLGHVLAAKAAKEALGLDKVLLVPDAQPPHKALPEGSPSPEQRVEMARLAAEGEPWLEVSALELSRPGKSYTSDTLRALSGKYPGDTLYLLMGTDMFLSLHTWHEPEGDLLPGSDCGHAPGGGQGRRHGAAEGFAGGAIRRKRGGAPQCTPGDFLHPSSADADSGGRGPLYGPPRYSPISGKTGFTAPGGIIKTCPWRTCGTWWCRC